MFRTISVQQLEYLLDGERTFTLLDVREQREYEAGHLLGAVNLPYERLDEAEAEIPMAIAEAFRNGNLGVMDYYKFQNIQADTRMREGIVKPEKK